MNVILNEALRVKDPYLYRTPIDWSACVRRWVT